MYCLAQTSGRIGGGRHGSGFPVARGISGDVYGCWLGDARTGIKLKMVFGAGRAVTFAGIFITQAGQFITSADAIAVAGLRRRFDGNECHNREIVRSRAKLCKRAEAEGKSARK